MFLTAEEIKLNLHASLIFFLMVGTNKDRFCSKSRSFLFSQVDKRAGAKAVTQKKHKTLIG